MANECLDIITEAAGDALSDDELVTLLEDMQQSKEIVAGNAGLEAIEAAMFKRGEVIANEIQLEAMNKKRMVYKNILIENKIIDMAHETDAMVDDPMLGVKARIGGVNAPIKDASNSTGAMMRSIRDQWFGALLADLDKAGVRVQFNNMKGEFENEVRRVLADLNTNGAKISGSKDAVAIARIMKKYQDVTLKRKNMAGAYIKPKRGYTGPQMYDPRKIQTPVWRQKSVDPVAEKWKSDHMEWLDWDTMRVPKESRAKFLDEVHFKLARGEDVGDLLDEFGFKFQGNGSIAKRLSEHRTLIYKNADAAGKANAIYGTGSLREQFNADISSSARAVAVLETLGDDPETMVERVRKRLMQEYAGDNEKLNSIQEKKRQAVTTTALLAEVTGSINIGGKSDMAVLSQNLRAVKTLSVLGRVIYSVLGDLSYTAANSMYRGKGAGSAWGEAFTNIFRGTDPAKKKDLALRMGIGLNGWIGDMQRGFGSSYQLDGKMSKAMGLFFKLNMLNWWTDSNQRGVAYVIANDMALEASKAFDRLPDDFRRLLNIYGIDARKWEIARQAVEVMEDGNKYLMPDNVDNAKGAAFKGLSKSQQERLKTETKESLYTLLTNEVTISVPEPGAREMAMMRRGYRPDTVSGQAIRFVWQFKGFGVSVLSRVMGRQIYGTGSKTFAEQMAKGIGANLGLINGIVGMTVLGYFSMQLKEVTKGRMPRPDFDKKTMFAAMLHGGGLGIYGDFLFAEYNRFGGGPLDTLSGPVIGDAAALLTIMQKIRSGDQDVRGDTLRLVKSNLPFMNLFYIQDVMNYLIWYQLQEVINPGYLKRNERRVERENNQEYWLPPSSVVKTGGGFQ